MSSIGNECTVFYWKQDERVSTFRMIHGKLKCLELFVVLDFKDISMKTVEQAWFFIS